MSTNKATLKDISKAMNVSMTTIHRALHNKEGVSEKIREEIKRVAGEMGYRTNYVAASLKRKTVKFAIIIPEPTNENRYYYLCLWQGIRKFLDEVSEFNIETLEFSYPLSVGSNGNKLKEVYEKHGDALDGILTVGVNHNQSKYFIEKFHDKNIPVVLIGADLLKDKRLCCVKTYDHMAGSLAAELLTSFIEKSQNKKIMLTGDMEMMDQYYNAEGFENYMRDNVPNIEIIKVSNLKDEEVYLSIKEVLLREKDIYAIYSCSARNTVQMCKVAIDLNMQNSLKLVGNDSFPESIELLRQNILNAIIHKRPNRQAYIAMKVLFDYVVKGEYPDSSTILINSLITMKSNLDICI
ncbi:substrate-binding domain-containing protein [Cellulosilyticum sp. I15G10I2]|uniref:substrate-binding domain-containing protein n=1 Tax=Cellulosilyticum sp. I15G10I2 TaxID=1892843 RepID=UPI00085C56A1|nr:substrate-binding domain-containing protein [Cellulosilyticum sp. I15G10I2]